MHLSLYVLAGEGIMAYPTVYGLWTNKGGVGKTTLTYHLATNYAELFPEKTVVAIDMCPQSNLSATLLTQTTGVWQQHCTCVG
jgi:cellulose biosynthesis protein BcsQ